MVTKGKGESSVSATLRAGRQVLTKGYGGGKYVVTCRRKDGTIRWKDEIVNLWVASGIHHTLDVVLGATAKVSTWYIGLMDSTPSVVDGDTLASHPGWTEISNYTGDRKEWVKVRSAKSVDNSASKAAFAINQDGTTIGGAFVASAASGTTGTLFSGGAFSGGDKAADNGDSLEITYTFSLAAS